ncbi:ML domain-containing protein [Blastocladiella britannica]|nr:ML domain-containing protein [Blastocladiella britannica]
MLLALPLILAVAMMASARPTARVLSSEVSLEHQVDSTHSLKKAGAGLLSSVLHAGSSSDPFVSVSEVAGCRKNSDADALTLETLEVIPDPPSRGSAFKVHATGMLKRRVDRPAQIHVVVKLGRFIQLLKKDLDLCDSAGEVKLSCPLDEGPIVIDSSFDLPKEIPPGTYYVTADVTDQEGGPVTCIQAQLKFA